jgi:nucleotide-binding universal stress UspA family protein
MMASNEIVVGIDGSEPSRRALQWAAQQAHRTGAPLRILHTWRLPIADDVAGGRRYRGLTATDARAHATRWVAEALGEHGMSAHCQLDVREGPAGRVLVELSRAAQLLVIGTREHVGLRRIATGSVSHYCLAHAACPVVAVPPAAEGDGGNQTQDRRHAAAH